MTGGEAEPLWRKVLCWGTVTLFLTVPGLILSVRLISDSFPNTHPWGNWEQSLKEAEYIVPYFQSLTALVFGLAGLNTWDRHNGKKSGPEKANGGSPRARNPEP